MANRHHAGSDDPDTAALTGSSGQDAAAIGVAIDWAANRLVLKDVSILLYRQLGDDFHPQSLWSAALGCHKANRRIEQIIDLTTDGSRDRGSAGSWQRQRPALGTLNTLVAHQTASPSNVSFRQPARTIGFRRFDPEKVQKCRYFVRTQRQVRIPPIVISPSTPS
jgi:hypothetical protein